jgi:putative membrane protein
MGWVWVIVVLLVVATIIAIILAIVLPQRRAIGSAPPTVREGGAARRVLDERYARGEIDSEEYRTRRDLLEGRG